MSHWSRTQQVVSLSSAEAELNAICKATAEGLGAKNMTAELLHPMELEVLTDASAARGVIQRQGAGRVKHLSVKQLWVQERETKGELKISKIPRLLNYADLLTHHWSEAEGLPMLTGMCVELRGRTICPTDAPARGGQGAQGD